MGKFERAGLDDWITGHGGEDGVGPDTWDEDEEGRKQAQAEALGILIERAVAEQKRLDEEALAEEEREHQRYVDERIRLLRERIEECLRPEVREALDLSYEYSPLQGYYRDGHSDAHAVVQVGPARCEVTVDEYAGGGQGLRWVLHTPSPGRQHLSFSSTSPVEATRNLLLTIHEWRMGKEE